MTQPVAAILARQDELTAKARQFTGDINEAALLVGRVVCKALGRFRVPAAEKDIELAMRRDLDLLIEQARRARH
jgi:hypothetical protein